MQKIVGIGKWRARYWVHTELGGYHIFLGYEFWVFIFASSSFILAANKRHFIKFHIAYNVARKLMEIKCMAKGWINQRFR